MLLKGKLDRPAAENFFGTGNETTDSAGADVNYYQVFSKRYFGGIGLSRNVRNRHFIDLTFFYQNIQANKNAGKYIAEKESGLAVDRHGYAGAEAGYHYSNTNSQIIATRGVNFFAAGGYIQQTSGARKSFFKTTSSIALYIPLGKVVSIAARAGGSTIFGTANYYHMGKLGGNVNLRGFPRERFYGKSSFYTNNEIRFIANTRNFFFNGKIGVLGFYDRGRVWQPGEISRKWHAGYGGGIIVSPFNKAALTATYGWSAESTNLLLRASMFF
jgi:hemolysin activation/secretion protein